MTFAFYLMIVVFVFGYLCIALEHPLKVNKTATALVLCCAMWSIVAIGGTSAMIPQIAAVANGMGEALTQTMNAMGIENAGAVRDYVTNVILTHLGDTGEIVFFLLGAMTIVEIVDSWGGFRVITDHIHETSKVKLLWILGLLTFFMSAVLDNLTTTIVMLALLGKLVPVLKERWFFASMIVIAANAGGAWSPIGDVTTIMLWIAQKVSALNIIIMTLSASLVSILVPFIILSFTMRGKVDQSGATAFVDNSPASRVSHKQRKTMLILGICLLLFVPVFKTFTHLPPYIGMLGALGVIWIVSEAMRPKDPADPNHEALTAPVIMRRVDFSSILFFLGILMAVGALQACGHLTLMATNLDQIQLGEPHKYFLISGIIGILSSVVDNVPLVAATMGMYDFPMDHYFWELIAYCAGTGGSMLIIGSAAGVAAMGIEKIDFIWYLKHVSWIALIGYLAGMATYIGQYYMIHG